MAKTLAELYNARFDSALRNRVEVATDNWILAQASRQPAEGESDAEIGKYKSLAYDALLDPESTSRRLMRIVPIAAEAQQIDLANDAALAGLVATLMDVYALARPTQ